MKSVNAIAYNLHKFFFSCFMTIALVAAWPAAAHERPDFTELVKQNHQSVVNISTTNKTTPNRPGGQEIPNLEDSPFGEFFRKFLEQQGVPGPREQQFDSDSLGSGFIISEDGYVLTNNHVVEGADEIVVRLFDRRQFVARLVGTDPRSDVAVLKIDASDLPAARIGKSSELQVGEWVLAIGSPFGFDFSVTAGIVSATGRSLPRENYVPFIQTDVAINPGNSGGPLFNLKGEVVGINSQIYSRTGGFMGLSFSIPIEMAVDIADQLKDSGRVSRGWLGVIIQEVTRELAESFSMSTAHGALISRILPESPAASSDLQVGDIIVKFNGSRVEKSSSLPPLVGRVRAGGEAEVEVVRGGQRETIMITIGELPSQAELSSGGGQAEKSTMNTKLGIRVETVDDKQRDDLDLTSGGVVVAEIVEGPARTAGVRKDDVITMIDNNQIESIDDFNKVVKSLDSGDSVAILVQRPQGPIFLAMTVE